MFIPAVKRNIFLIGPMGAGKTTIGRTLASYLRLEFIDSDHEIERRAGANIAWIFDVEGEPGFRAREAAVIDDLSQREGILLATGGGSVLRAENRQHLRARGVVLFLDASLEMQIKRTAKDKKRPLLQTDDPVAVLRRLKIERDPLYTELADIKVTVGDNKTRRIMSMIMKKLDDTHFTYPGKRID
ncbi:MAG: shikimate kinase [Candidatus Azotimanducaceae bacterium]|jgi:shikimate kinase